MNAHSYRLLDPIKTEVSQIYSSWTKRYAYLFSNAEYLSMQSEVDHCLKFMTVLLYCPHQATRDSTNYVRTF